MQCLCRCRTAYNHCNHLNIIIAGVCEDMEKAYSSLAPLFSKSIILFVAIMGNCAVIFLLRWYATSTWRIVLDAFRGIIFFFFSFSFFSCERRGKLTGRKQRRINSSDFIFAFVRIEAKNERYNLIDLIGQRWPTIICFFVFCSDFHHVRSAVDDSDTILFTQRLFTQIR